MNVMFAGMIGGWEMVVILIVILMLFGSRKLPELARGLGQGIKEFKKATREVTDEVTNAMDDTQPQKRLPNNSIPAQTQAQQAQAQPQQDSVQGPTVTKV